MSMQPRLAGAGGISTSAAPRPVVRRSANQSYPLRQTAQISPVRNGVPNSNPTSPNAYPHAIHTGPPAIVSTKTSTPVSGATQEPIATSARTGQIQTRQPQSVNPTVTLQPRFGGEDKHEARFQELQAYIDTQIESIRASNPASPSNPVSPSSRQDVADDIDTRLESTFNTMYNTITEETDQKIFQMQGTLERNLEERMNSVLEQRIDQAMQEMHASHEHNLHQFKSAINQEIDQKLAQAEMQASQEARAIAAQATEESKSMMHAHMSRDVGMSQEASALLREHHDKFSAKFQHHDEHTAMFRQRQDEHAALLHKMSHKYDELQEMHARNPAPTPNVATMHAVEQSIEQSIGTVREQMSYDVQRTVDDFMKKFDQIYDNMAIERREREGSDYSLSEQISALTANERNICARMDDLTMEAKNMGETAMALTAQINSSSERSVDRSLEHHVSDPRYDDIMNQVQNLHSRFSEIESARPLERSLEHSPQHHVGDPRYDDIMNQVQNLHSRFSEIEPVRQSCSPLLGRVGAYEAQGFAAKPAVVKGNANETKSVLVGEGSFKESGGVREIRNFDEVGPSPVNIVQGTNIALMSEEKLRGLPEKSASLLDRMHKISNHPSRTQVLATALADSSCDGAQATNIARVSEEKLRGLSAKSSSLLDRMHKVSQHPLGTRDFAVASADSNGDDNVISRIQVIEAQAANIQQRLNTLQPQEKLSELWERIDNLENATAQAYPEKFKELRAKAEDLEGRLISMEQEKEANLGWSERQRASLQGNVEGLHERLQKLESRTTFFEDK